MVVQDPIPEIEDAGAQAERGPPMSPAQSGPGPPRRILCQDLASEPTKIYAPGLVGFRRAWYTLHPDTLFHAPKPR